MASSDDEIDRAFAELRAQYLETMGARFAELASTLRVAAARDDHTGASWSSARRLAHRLNGTAGSYGFADVSAHARVLEDALRSLEDMHGGDDAVAAAERALEGLEACVAGHVAARRE